MLAPAAASGTAWQQQPQHGPGIPSIQARARHPDNKKRSCLFCSDKLSAYVACDGCLPYWNQTSADLRNGIIDLGKAYSKTKDIEAYTQNIDRVFRPACMALRECSTKADSARSIRAVQPTVQGAADFDAAVTPMLTAFAPLRMSPHPFAAAAMPAAGGFFSGQFPPAGMGGPTHSPHLLTTTAQQLLPLPLGGGLVQGGLGAPIAVPPAGPVVFSEGHSPAGAAPLSREAEIRALIKEEVATAKAELRQLLHEEMDDLYAAAVQKESRKRGKSKRSTEESAR